MFLDGLFIKNSNELRDDTAAQNLSASIKDIARISLPDGITCKTFRTIIKSDTKSGLK